MKILFKPRSGAKGEEITFRSGATLKSGSEYEVGSEVDENLAHGLLLTGDAVEVKEEKRAEADQFKRKKRKGDAAREILGFGSKPKEGDEAKSVDAIE